MRPQVVYALERGKLAKAVSLVDSILWSNDAVTERLLGLLRQTREFLFQRRNLRSRGGSDA
jgi:hypothetical protein